jgi:hypothetical protein
MARRPNIAEAITFHRRVEEIAHRKEITQGEAYLFCERMHRHRTGKKMYKNYISFANSRTYLMRKYRALFA